MLRKALAGGTTTDTLIYRKLAQMPKGLTEGGFLLTYTRSGPRLLATLLLALGVLASFVATPAMAQTSEQDSEQGAESGDAGQDVGISQSGDNSNQCVGVQPVSNTGNAITDVDIIIETPDGDQFTKRAKVKKRDREKPSDHQYNERDHDNDNRNDNDNDNNKRQRFNII